MRGRIDAVRRRLFNLLAAVSLILCLAALLAWVVDRNTTTSRECDVGWGKDICGVYLLDGGVYCARFETHRPLSRPFVSCRTDREYSTALYCTTVLYKRHGPLGRLHGFGVAGWVSRSTHEQFAAACVVTFPSWLAISAFAIAPALCLWRLFRDGRVRRRERTGHCPACGYDLRATPERCPECGAVAEASVGRGGGNKTGTRGRSTSARRD
jgi:hypothetical protein